MLVDQSSISLRVMVDDTAIDHEVIARFE